MHASEAIRTTRRRARLTQRELAVRAGVPQSTVARIESGAIDPRARTIQLLLRACGADLGVVDRLGVGVDRTTIRERLKLSPGQRLRELERAWADVSRIRSRARRPT
jgi:transcriptional regulator with XRE-family HTH domain